MLDVAGHKERFRLKRMRRLAVVLAPIAAWMWWRVGTGREIVPLPTLPADAALWLPFVILFILIGAMMIIPMLVNGRSPHTVFMPAILLLVPWMSIILPSPKSASLTGESGAGVAYRMFSGLMSRCTIPFS